MLVSTTTTSALPSFGSSRIRVGGHSGVFDDSWFRNSAAGSRLATVPLRAPDIPRGMRAGAGSGAPGNLCRSRLASTPTARDASSPVPPLGAHSVDATGRCVWIMKSRRARRLSLTGFAGLPGRTSSTISRRSIHRAELSAFVSERRCCAGVVRVWRPSPTCRERARKSSW